MHPVVSAEESKKAQQAHEVFLFNLIFNHVFLFIVTVSAPSMEALTLIVPALSLTLMGYTLWMARRARLLESHYVTCHWQLAARRTLIFAALWLVCGACVLALLAASDWHPGPQHYALGALTFLPTMGTMLTLILLESEALQHARHNTLPKAAAARCRLQAALGISA